MLRVEFIAYSLFPALCLTKFFNRVLFPSFKIKIHEELGCGIFKIPRLCGKYICLVNAGSGAEPCINEKRK